MKTIAGRIFCSAVPLAAAGILVAAGAIVSGRAIDRWGVSPDVAERAAAVAALPAAVGDWDGEAVPMDAGSLEVANVTGYMCRRYTHKFTHEQLTVLVVSGRPGHVAAHPPEVCYAAAGYAPGPKQVRKLGPDSACWEASFVRPADTLRIVWGWGVGDAWVASSAPRVEFATAGNLFKMYVIRVAADPTRDEAAIAGFLASFLPECRGRLSPTPAAGLNQ